MSEILTETPVTITLPQGSSTHASPLVLVADANPASRLRRARQLEARGFFVAFARTGFEAIVKASCHLPDFIVVDESLGGDEVEDTTTLLSTCPATAHIPVVRLGRGRRLPTRMLSSVVRHR